MIDFRDMAISALADDEAALRARVAELTSERDVFRELLVHALDQAHDLMQSNLRLKTCLRRHLHVTYGPLRNAA